MRRFFSSVRARAALGATAVVAVALIGAGTAVFLSLRANLTEQASSQAESAARRVAAQLAAGTPYANLELPDGEDHPVQVIDREDRLRAASEDLEDITGTGVAAVVPRPSLAPDGDEEEDDRDESDPDVGEISDRAWYASGQATVDGETGKYQFAAVEVTTRDDTTVTVYAGAPLSATDGAASTALTSMLIGLPALVLIVGGVTWLATQRALRPVEDIRQEMAAITASEDLSRRVPEPDTHDEIARLAKTTNETLSALEASVERQRRFVADASHELRSPIASLRTQLEVAAAHPELLDLDGAVEDTVRLQGLAADLLLLARLDAGERPSDARVDLTALVREEVSQRTADRIPVRVHADESVEVSGSRGQLARVLGNLVDNAQRHARSRITVTLSREGERALLTVADDGAGVPEDERERIFERFVRLDDARTRDEGGAGLGLAIARDVVERHSGRLSVGDSPDGGALFRVELPLAG
ncbi:HAMP domain-containing histidine kinase [Streptomyces sp. TRM66268-LWL]|uniref:histidine kinase n=1 Tax=Streptomyces polyasparticus TaxID=2767826 RepID=A0ABR7S7D1_9ACTN|nr:HAMP domain-containing sensor histidine kinase [Streptomyces polyasparticus]MBC9711382.1 HAMP domain-containing histidine kinase [Streptomyces polyasparticus]